MFVKNFNVMVSKIICKTITRDNSDKDKSYFDTISIKEKERIRKNVGALKDLLINNFMDEDLIRFKNKIIGAKMLVMDEGLDNDFSNLFIKDSYVDSDIGVLNLLPFLSYKIDLDDNKFRTPDILSSGEEISRKFISDCEEIIEETDPKIKRSYINQMNVLYSANSYMRKFFNRRGFLIYIFNLLKAHIMLRECVDNRDNDEGKNEFIFQINVTNLVYKLYKNNLRKIRQVSDANDELVDKFHILFNLYKILSKRNCYINEM